MFDIFKWLAWMAVITFCILVLRALFRKPASAGHKRWEIYSTPELIEYAFKSKQMIEIAERTAKRHLDTYGSESIFMMYAEVFEAFVNQKTSDGYEVRGQLVDLGDGNARLTFELERDDVITLYTYETTYVYLLRVTDALSLGLLSRLDWHNPKQNSEG